MKLTKYGHACVIVEKNGSRVVIDPGSLTELPADLSNVVAVVCTHMHGDHTNALNIQKIVDMSPDVVIYGHPESLENLSGINCEKIAVTEDKTLTVGQFTLVMQVVDHAIIWQTSPCKNLTVKVDAFYYYPGDSLTLIDDEVEVVGVPLSAPWLKTADAIEFARAIPARYVMPTHNGLFNEYGHEFNHNWLKVGIEDTKKNLIMLKPTESFEA